MFKISKVLKWFKMNLSATVEIAFQPDQNGKPTEHMGLLITIPQENIMGNIIENVCLHISTSDLLQMRIDPTDPLCECLFSYEFRGNRSSVIPISADRLLCKYLGKNYVETVAQMPDITFSDNDDCVEDYI